MSQDAQNTDRLDVAPYFDVLFERLRNRDPEALTAFGRHVHWGYWPEPARATGTAEDYAAAAERLCRLVWEAAGIKDGMQVLDVGCGLGGTIASLNECFSNLELVGVNIDSRQLEHAAATVTPRNGNRIRYVHGDACRLSFPPASFDAVLAVECIFHFESRADFFRGAAEVLRPGGRMSLSDFVPPQELLEKLQQHDPAKDEATCQTYGKINVLCPVETYRDLADTAGFSLLAARDINSETMPTYPFLQGYFRTHHDRRTARVHSRATGRLEVACDLRLLRYTILSFARRAANVTRSA